MRREEQLDFFVYFLFNKLTPNPNQKTTTKHLMPARKQKAKKELPPALKQWAIDVKAYREKHSTKANTLSYKQAMVNLSAERKRKKKRTNTRYRSAGGDLILDENVFLKKERDIDIQDYILDWRQQIEANNRFPENVWLVQKIIKKICEKAINTNIPADEIYDKILDMNLKHFQTMLKTEEKEKLNGMRRMHANDPKTAETILYQREQKPDDVLQSELSQRRSRAQSLGPNASTDAIQALQYDRLRLLEKIESPVVEKYILRINILNFIRQNNLLHCSI